jgi:hypothetical protein
MDSSALLLQCLLPSRLMSLATGYDGIMGQPIRIFTIAVLAFAAGIVVVLLRIDARREQASGEIAMAH